MQSQGVLSRYFGSVVALATLCVAPGPSAQAACSAPWGDLDGSGQVDVIDVQCDVLAALAALGGEAPPACIVGLASTADVNCDSTTNVTDVTLVIQLALSISLDALLDADSNGCPDACQPCGDGVCDTALGEAWASCPQDCPLPATPGDICEAPLEVIAAVPWSGSGTTKGFADDYGHGADACPGDAKARGGGTGSGPSDVVYRLVAPYDGIYEVRIKPDFYAAVYAVTDCSSIDTTCLGGMQAPYLAKSMNLALHAGDVVHIIVDGGFNTGSLATGGYELSIAMVPGGCPDDAACDDADPCTLDACVNATCTHETVQGGACAPAGDACDVPLTIDTLPYAYAGTTTDMSSSVAFGSSGCSGMGPDAFDTTLAGWNAPDAVFALTPSQSTQYAITVYAPFHAALSVFTDCADVDGTCATAGTLVQGTTLKLTPTLKAGVPYLIAVDGVFGAGNNAGPFTLTVEAGCLHAADCPAPSDPCATVACVAGRCVEAAASCDDGIPCTDDSCVPNVGCQHVPVQDCAVAKALYATSFECGASDWTLQKVIGDVPWSIDATPDPPGAYSPGCSLNFNNGADYVSSNGPSSGGWAISPPIDATDATELWLTFRDWVDVPDVATLYVEVSTDGFSTWDTFDVGPAQGSAAWADHALDLSEFAGTAFQLRFKFYAAGPLTPGHAGWFVDDVVISPIPPTWCVTDADCPDDPDPCIAGVCAGGVCTTASALTTECLPSGDRCANAVVVDSVPFSHAGDLHVMHDDYGYTSCPGRPYPSGGGTGSGAPDAVYAFTAPFDATFRFSVTGATFDANLYVVSDCTDIDAACLAASDGLSDEVIDLPLTAGTAVWAVVDGWQNAGNPPGGTFFFDVTRHCTSDADCDVDNPCVTALCDGGTCLNLPVACNDGDPCTDDSCDPATGCVATPIPGCAFLTLPYTTGFDCGSTDWTLETIKGNIPWSIDATPDPPGAHDAGGCSLNFNDGVDYAMDAPANTGGRATSPPIDATGAATLYLSFWEWVDAPQAARYVMVSDDEFVTWSTYEIPGPAASQQWVQRTLDLSAYAGTVLGVRFFLDSVALPVVGAAGWFIDDLTLDTTLP